MNSTTTNTFSRIEKKEAFTAVGIEIVIPQIKAKFVIPEIAKMVIARKGEIKNIVGTVDYGISLKFEEGILTYLYGYEVSKEEDVPSGMVSRKIPTQEYAVHIHKGPIENFMETLDYAWGIWLPKSEYQCVKSPSFEVYGENFILDGPNVNDSVTEYYIPIKKK